MWRRILGWGAAALVAVLLAILGGAYLPLTTRREDIAKRALGRLTLKPR